MLIDNIPSPSFDCKELNEVSSAIQENIQTSDHIKNYVESLWQATENPKKFAVDLEGIDMEDFLVA
ncbi:MoxR family ATPase, partial [Methylophilaceae bacterium]|nr:MoxR family ATPase [Methylophilaceae bacterium]